MLSLYRGLLYLYPSLYRREYADEMISVFRDAQDDLSAASVTDRISFRIREILGLLAGALRERVPRSTVFLMSIIFAGVILAMEKANLIQVKYAAGVGSIWPSLPWFLGSTLLFTWAAALVVWGILFALGRTGTHRLENIESSPSRAE
jgi:hypothetical protein